MVRTILLAIKERCSLIISLTWVRRTITCNESKDIRSIQSGGNLNPDSDRNPRRSWYSHLSGYFWHLFRCQTCRLDLGFSGNVWGTLDFGPVTRFWARSVFKNTAQIQVQTEIFAVRDTVTCLAISGICFGVRRVVWTWGFQEMLEEYLILVLWFDFEIDLK